MKTLSPESDPFSKERPNRLRVPQQRVLRALMPTDDGKTVPLTRIQLAERMEYTRKSGTITRALNGIQEGSPSGNPYLGLLDLGLVEEVELDGNKALQITPPGRKAVEELGELPKPKDKAACTNRRYLDATLTEEEIIEGRRLLKLHKVRERKPQVVHRKKKSVLAATGRLLCEACDFDFAETYGKLGEGFAECHHRLPLADYDEEAPLTPATRTMPTSSCSTRCRSLLPTKSVTMAGRTTNRVPLDELYRRYVDADDSP